MTIQDLEQFPMSDSLGRRCEAHFARCRTRQVMSYECLDQTSLAIAARSEHGALRVIHSPAPNNHLHGSMLMAIFARRSAALYGIGHFLQFSFLLLFR